MTAAVGRVAVERAASEMMAGAVARLQRTGRRRDGGWRQQALLRRLLHLAQLVHRRTVERVDLLELDADGIKVAYARRLLFVQQVLPQ